MMLWYSTVFAISSAIVFSIAVVSLSTSLRRQDHLLIESKVKEYAALYNKGGIKSLKDAAQKEEKFFVRMSDPANKTVFQQIGADMIDEDTHTLVFDPKDFEGSKSRQPWNSFPATDDEEDLLEIAATPLADGNSLQVGMTNENRDDTLDQFFNLFLITMLVIVVMGALGGAFLTYRLLRPVRQVTEAARAIITTGRMEARVSTATASGEIQELVLLFNTMLDRIEALINGLRDSLDNVAHDLRTPVSRLRIAAESALDASQGETACKEALADCLEESERVMTMLNTLMDISEAETGTMKLDLKEWNIATLIRDIVELYTYAAEEKGVTVSTALPEELLLTLDRNRFHQAVANLLDNAIKYTGRSGRVDVEAVREKDQILVRVRDNGIGIEPEDMENVWDRLYRGDKSRSQRGLGLGLSFVRAIVKAHNGSVAVTSNPNQGSVFTISFPTT